MKKQENTRYEEMMTKSAEKTIERMVYDLLNKGESFTSRSLANLRGIETTSHIEVVLRRIFKKDHLQVIGERKGEPLFSRPQENFSFLSSLRTNVQETVTETINRIKNHPFSIYDLATIRGTMKLWDLQKTLNRLVYDKELFLDLNEYGQHIYTGTETLSPKETTSKISGVSDFKEVLDSLSYDESLSRKDFAAEILESVADFIRSS